ncbi:hypothetical protein AB1Y20_012915 [Prymnesium parvum]|uniref:Uncharacterized protein n=1 Tax=Prymnesium parvum TaxID=97485 RepID=A0AB34ILX5_PRYPA
MQSAPLASIENLPHVMPSTRTSAPPRSIAETGLKRSLEEAPQRCIRLKWSGAPLNPSAGCDGRLHSFELFHAAAGELDTSGPSPQACVAAASLLASLLQVPLVAEFSFAPVRPNTRSPAPYPPVNE